MKNPNNWSDIEGWSDVDAEAREIVQNAFATPKAMFAKVGGDADFDASVCKKSTAWAQTGQIMMTEYKTLSLSLEEDSDSKIFDYLNFEWAYEDDILFITDITPCSSSDDETWKRALKSLTEIGLDLGVRSICIVVKESDDCNLIIHAAKAGYETDISQMETEGYSLEGILDFNIRDYEGDEVSNAVEAAADENEPCAIWDLADFEMEVDGETVTGFDILDGAVWFGILHLPDPSERDEEVRKRMKDYLGIEI